MGNLDHAVDPDALLVLVLWREPSGTWRVRVTRSTHVVDGEPERSYVATRADLLRAIEEWFDRAVTSP